MIIASRIVISLVAVVAIACGDRAGAAGRDSVAVPPIQAKSGRAAAGTLPAEVRAACAEVAASWRPVPSIALREIADSSVEDFSADSGRTRHACAVTVDDPVAFADSARVGKSGPARSDYWRSFARAGWIQLRYSADGPDGSETQYQRGRVRCLLDERWDGGDDSDSTYVPSPYYEQNTSCWWHPRAVADSDTVP